MTDAPLLDPAQDLIRSARFRRDREPGWRRLATLVETVERNGLRSLSYEETLELSNLYRQAMNALSVARTISLDKALLLYLDRLCARAYLVVYAPQESLRESFVRLFTTGIPRAVRRTRLALAIGFLALVLGVICGYLLCLQDPSWYDSFVPAQLAGERGPGASVEQLRRSLFSEGRHDGDGLALFATYLFSHNTGIAIFVFVLGIFGAAPSFVLTFYNGLVLGAFATVFVSAGLGYEMLGWLSIHGVTELAAICIACSGGAQLGLAVLLPGERSRGAALRHAGHDAVKLAILAGLMLVVAALVEGFLRQMVQSTEWRLVIGWGLGLGWYAWLTRAGRGEAAA